jgi:hypothetical protein
MTTLFRHVINQGRHQMRDTLTRYAAGVRALAETVDQIPPAQIAGVMAQAAELTRAAQVLQLSLTRIAEQHHTARREGAVSTDAWVAKTAGVSRSAAVRDVDLANALPTVAPHTHHSLTTPGGVSLEKAHLITRAMTRLPTTFSDAERATVETSLLEKAKQLSVEDLRRAARRALEAVDVKAADKAEALEIEKEEENAHQNSSLWLAASATNGLVEGGFSIPAFEADLLRAYLQAATAPRTNSLRVTQGKPDLGDQRLRNGQAFLHLLRHLPDTTVMSHGGVPATLVVTVEENTLRETTDRCGVTAFGTVVSPRELRRLACETGLLPMVLGGKSLPLDLGRQNRLFTRAQRIALAHRDQGCAFPGCDRPPGWCETHHIEPWKQGGQTDLQNGVFLCATHHRTIHNTGWRIQIRPDHTLQFIPPPHLGQQPRTNSRYQPLPKPPQPPPIRTPQPTLRT